MHKLWTGGFYCAEDLAKTAWAGNMKHAAIALITFLSACAVQDFQPPSAEDLSKMSNLQLCDMYSYTRYSKYRRDRSFESVAAAAYYSELLRRGALTERDKRDIKEKTIRVGMKDYVSICSWGSFTEINSSGGLSGDFNQYVINEYYGTGGYIYTRNGRVVSWQD
jgi:hypothetical protein